MVSPHVLIVDDEGSARETLEALLHVDRYALRSVGSGREAFECLEAEPVDLVILDVMMPALDGFDVCRAIRAHPTWRYLSVILVTALDGQDDLVRGIEAGADDFLSKPVERIVLRARVRALLKIRQRYRELEQRSTDPDALLRQRRDRIASAAGLSDRERSVLNLILMGQGHEEIGAALGISARTAKHHQARILEKLNAESRIDLLRIFA